MRNQKGFTLIEIIVVIAVLVIIIAFGMTIDLNSFKGDTFSAERNTIVSILERARSHAMANMFESSFGVCFISPNYIIFQGNTCTITDSELISANTNIATISDFSNPVKFPTIVFNRLAGTTTSASLITITIKDETKSVDVTINNEGTINW